MSSQYKTGEIDEKDEEKWTNYIEVAEEAISSVVSLLKGAAFDPLMLEKAYTNRFIR